MKRRTGCLVGLGLLTTGAVLLVGVAWLAFDTIVQSELGRWVFGLLFVVGGSMVALGAQYQPSSGTVVSVKRTADDGSRLIFAPIEVRYRDGLGTEHQVKTLVSADSTPFQTLHPGDPVKLLVCRTDPEIVRISGQPWLGRKKCELPSLD